MLSWNFFRPITLVRAPMFLVYNFYIIFIELTCILYQYTILTTYAQTPEFLSMNSLKLCFDFYPLYIIVHVVYYLHVYREGKYRNLILKSLLIEI